MDIGAALSGTEILSELDTSSVTSKSASRFDSVSSDLGNYEARCRGLRLISEDGLNLGSLRLGDRSLTTADFMPKPSYAQQTLTCDEAFVRGN